MTVVSQLGGLWMLLLLGFLVLRSGLPVWALLLGVSSFFAAAGLAAGLFDSRILQALPVRTIGLLENDLLQAMPLYVLMGVLLQRLTLADALYACLLRLLSPFAGAPVLAAFGLGTLLAPTNGSVAASSALLSRLIAPRLTHLGAAQSVSVMSVSATIGVVVPPSLVLLLLGDAMLSAHLEASRLPAYVQTSQTIINTRDVMHAALLPAVGVLLLWAVIACVKSRRLKPLQTKVKVSNGQCITGLITASTIVLLLAGVFTGRLYAVEAAATGAVLMLLFSFATRALNFAAWREVCMQALSLSGALFALLVGATTFSLVFRLFGTDRLLNSWLLGSSLTPIMGAAIVLVLVGLCAWVLDAFEMIFVIIPLVAPVLIVHLGDAQQAAVLLLLMLQLSFLVPPMGYAVMMARGRFPALTTRQLLYELWPMLLAQIVITTAVFAFPQTVHWLDAAPTTNSNLEPMTDAEVERQMREMSAP